MVPPPRQTTAFSAWLLRNAIIICSLCFLLHRFRALVDSFYPCPDCHCEHRRAKSLHQDIPSFPLHHPTSHPNHHHHPFSHYLTPRTSLESLKGYSVTDLADLLIANLPMNEQRRGRRGLDQWHSCPFPPLVELIPSSSHYQGDNNNVSDDYFSFPLDCFLHAFDDLFFGSSLARHTSLRWTVPVEEEVKYLAQTYYTDDPTLQNPPTRDLHPRTGTPYLVPKPTTLVTIDMTRPRIYRPPRPPSTRPPPPSRRDRHGHGQKEADNIEGSGGGSGGGSSSDSGGGGVVMGYYYWTPTLIQQVLATLLHEMVHAYFLLYQCGVCSKFNTYHAAAAAAAAGSSHGRSGGGVTTLATPVPCRMRSLSEGLGWTGHGAAFQRVATAVEASAAEVLGSHHRVSRHHHHHYHHHNNDADDDDDDEEEEGASSTTVGSKKKKSKTRSRKKKKSQSWWWFSSTTTTTGHTDDDDTRTDSWAWGKWDLGLEDAVWAELQAWTLHRLTQGDKNKKVAGVRMTGLCEIVGGTVVVPAGMAIQRVNQLGKIWRKTMPGGWLLS